MTSSTSRLAACLFAAVAVVVSACSGSSAGDSSAEPATTEQTAAATTTSTSPTARALVVPTTVAPLLSSTTTTEADPSSISLDELVVGDCVDIADAEGDAVEVGRARRHDCAEPHGLEVYHVASLNDDPSAPYPGDEAVLGAADQMCLDAFAPYVGIAYVDSSLEIAHLRPDQNVWLKGDRSVRCAVQERDLEPLVGTVKDSAR
jgi:hypothetical protein